MTIEEIKSQLEELIQDRESFMVGDYDKDIYDRDKEALEFAVKVLDSIIAEIKSDYENMRTSMPKELVFTCKLDKKQTQKLKEQIKGAKMSIEPVKESKWIKCSERMPDNTDEVWYCDEKGEIYCGFYSKEYKWWCSKSGVLKSCFVTHWMPLSKPPGVEQ